MNTNRILVVACLVAAGLSAACTRAVVYKESSPGPVVVEDGHGPPDHAPAWGYRRNHEEGDVELVYDPTIEVYVVSGYDACYYSAGQYFRFFESRWEWSVSLEGTWKIVKNNGELPPGLRHSHEHGKSRGHQKH